MKELFEELLENPYWSSLFIFLFQVLFIYLRTINVIYTSEKRIWPAVFSSVGVNLSVLISLVIGTKSLSDGHLLPIILFCIGTGIGTYIGVKQTIKKENSNSDET